MHVLVTGSSGLIGSEAVAYFDELGFRITGVDNNMRADFFGPQGDTTWNRARLEHVERANRVDVKVVVRALGGQIVTGLGGGVDDEVKRAGAEQVVDAGAVADVERAV